MNDHKLLLDRMLTNPTTLDCRCNCHNTGTKDFSNSQRSNVSALKHYERNVTAKRHEMKFYMLYKSFVKGYMLIPYDSQKKYTGFYIKIYKIAQTVLVICLSSYHSCVRRTERQSQLNQKGNDIYAKKSSMLH